MTAVDTARWTRRITHSECHHDEGLCEKDVRYVTPDGYVPDDERRVMPEIENIPTCDICGGLTLVPGQGQNPERCQSCEDQRIALGEAFLAESGTTWLYDKGAFVLRTVRKNLGLSHG